MLDQINHICITNYIIIYHRTILPLFIHIKKYKLLIYDLSIIKGAVLSCEKVMKCLNCLLNFVCATAGRRWKITYSWSRWLTISFAVRNACMWWTCLRSKEGENKSYQNSWLEWWWWRSENLFKPIDWWLLFVVLTVV